jgi:hypothetical protein
MYSSPWHTYGGSLGLTGEELRFFGGGVREDANDSWQLCEITVVRVARQVWWHPRKTVQVVAGEGRSSWFLVNRQDAVAGRIVQAVEAAGGNASLS